jgi:hypothetical protein
VSWFPDEGQPVRPAKALCASCIVQRECLSFALREQISEGVWGGASARERTELARQGITADLVQRYGVSAVQGRTYENDNAAIDAWLDELRLEELTPPILGEA